MSNFRPDIIYNDLHGIKFCPKNTSESLHVDSNQKKMKYRVIFQFMNLFTNSTETNRQTQTLLQTISTLSSR